MNTLLASVRLIPRDAKALPVSAPEEPLGIDDQPIGVAFFLGKGDEDAPPGDGALARVEIECRDAAGPHLGDEAWSSRPG